MFSSISLSRGIVAGLGIVWVAGSFQPAAAQQVPSTVEPGRPERPAPALPRKTVPLEWIISLPGGAEAPAHLAEETIEFADLKVVGATAFQPSELEDIFSRHRGTEITFGQLYGFARAIQARYQKNGYLLSFAYVPPQKVGDGVYTVSVVEGYVAEIIVEGVDGWLKNTLEGVLASIAGQRPLHISNLERQLLLANDAAGITASGILRPSEDAQGAADLVVKVSHKPIDAGFQWDNRGSKYSGPKRIKVNGSANSIVGLGESLSVSGSTVPTQSREVRTIDVSYSHPLGENGLRVSMAWGFNRSVPGYLLKNNDVKTISRHAELDLSYPLIRSRAQNLSLGGGITFRSSDVDFLNLLFSRDRLRMARASVAYNNSGFLGGATALNLNITQGLAMDFLDPTNPDVDTMSRADAKTSFTKFDVFLTRAQQLYGNIFMVFSAAGQYSYSALASSEEFAVGGEQFGRGYDSGEITGDRGVAASLEIGRDFRLEESLIRNVHPYAFYDVGRVWDKKTDASEGISHSLASAGLGVRIGLDYGISLEAELAKPLTRVPAAAKGRESPRLFVTFSAEF